MDIMWNKTLAYEKHQVVAIELYYVVFWIKTSFGKWIPDFERTYLLTSTLKMEADMFLQTFVPHPPTRLQYSVKIWKTTIWKHPLKKYVLY